MLRKLKGHKKGMTLLHLYLKKEPGCSALTQVENGEAGWSSREQRETAWTSDLVCLGAQLIVLLTESM